MSEASFASYIFSRKASLEYIQAKTFGLQCVSERTYIETNNRPCSHSPLWAIKSLQLTKAARLCTVGRSWRLEENIEQAALLNQTNCPKKWKNLHLLNWSKSSKLKTCDHLFSQPGGEGGTKTVLTLQPRAVFGEK